MTCSTPYSGYEGASSIELYSMFRQDTWCTLSADEKQGVLQEVANREAAKYDNAFTIDVSLKDLPSDLSGYEEKGEVVINREMVVSNTLSTRYGNETITYNLPDGSYRALECVLHESEHAVQEAKINGIIPADEKAVYALEANDTTLSVVDGQIGSQYLDGRTSFGFYYLQPCELEAHKNSQDAVAEIIETLRTEYGYEASMDAYLGRLQTEGYQAQIAKYNQMYNCDDLPKEIQTVLMNTYFQQNNSVDPQINSAVKAEMIASANHILNNNKEAIMSNNNNGFEPKAVTSEQFAATLRDSVNQFYTHAINDPTLSHDEALSQTYQMSENHFNAIAEFEAEMNQSAEADGSGIESGNGVADSGMEGGEGVGDSGGVGM